MALMHRPVDALQQSWLRTKARDFAGYMRVAALQANSSNDTIYADADGHIAYLHPQFVPVRDDRFDYRDPVDGSRSGDRLARPDPARPAAARSAIRAPAGSTTPTMRPGAPPAPTARAQADFPALHGQGRRQSARRPCHPPARAARGR